jgi:hypothetical protein
MNEGERETSRKGSDIRGGGEKKRESYNSFL